tara:strand:- start:1802 stop:2077 length:276 start_codon:yes stop_codon:yes gene_type:complete
MLRWAIRAAAANSYKRKIESASRSAKRNFNRAKREKNNIKQTEYMSEGLSDLADAVSNIAEMSFVSSLLVESIQKNLDEQTKDIVSKIKGR